MPGTVDFFKGYLLFHQLGGLYQRTAGMVMLTFLTFNSLEVIAAEMDYYRVMMAVAGGHMNKEQLTEWLRTVTTGTPPEMA